MVLRLSDKKVIVEELNEIAQKSVSAIIADYRGLPVSEMTGLRKSARELGIVLRIYRNTLAKRAVQDTNFACMQEKLVGPVMLLFSQDEPGAAARLVRDFAKTRETFKVKALVIEGRLLEAEQLAAVANLPTREQAIATLMSVMLAPVTKLVRTVAEPYAQAARVLAAIRDKKQASN